MLQKVVGADSRLVDPFLVPTSQIRDFAVSFIVNSISVGFVLLTKQAI